MNMAVFWDVAVCSLIEIDRRFRGAYLLHCNCYDEAPLKRRWTSSRLSSRSKVRKDSHLQQTVCSCLVCTQSTTLLYKSS